MPTIYVDNNAHHVVDGQNLLQACLQLGFDLPYFCWHPALHSVGACRQCAVKQFRDEHDTRGRIVMACMTPATEGARISIADPEAVAFRAGNVEWLMTNHPHDCPVCDEGGECHLQDMTVMTGHDYRHYRFSKRTHRNQYLGPFVNHEMNRCIQCYRCVRFYCDYAGGRDLAVFAAHDHVYFGRQEDGVLENEFSGNLVEVCPTGVFTDAALKHHYTRKWDLQTAPSICVHCALGCNTIPGERSGTLRRIQNRYHHEVNGYFLCDRGRYGHEFVNSASRIRTPLARMQPEATPTVITPAEAIARLAGIFGTGDRVIGIGSPRASLEANYALRKLVGPDRFYTGVSAAQGRFLSLVIETLHNGQVRTPTLREVESHDAALVLGEDVVNVAPRLALALRQAMRRQPSRAADRLHIPEWDDASRRAVAREEHGPLYVATTHATKLNDLATRSYYAAPGDIARLGLAIAQRLGGTGEPPLVLPEGLSALAEEIAQTLRDAERPLIIAGASLGDEAIGRAAVRIASALSPARPAGLCFILPECNSLGLSLFGAGQLREAMQRVAGGNVDTLIILENDLYRHGNASAVDNLLSGVKHVVAIDCITSDTTGKADLVLPAATFAEGDGTLVSSESRAQRFFQVFVPDGAVRESWRWLRDLMVATGHLGAAKWPSLDDVIADLVTEFPMLEGIRDAAPSAAFRVAGMRIPRQPPRWSGRTALNAGVDVHEPKPPDDPDSPLAFSMEGLDGQPPLAALIPRYWAPGWNSVQAVNKFQSEVGGPLRGGDPGRRLIEPLPLGAPISTPPSVVVHGPAPSAPIPPAELPPPFAARTAEWLIVPLYHLFGSEPLSALTPGIRELMPPPYLALNSNDAKALGLRPGDEASVELGGVLRGLTVRLVPELGKGIAGVPAGIVSGADLPAWAKIGRAAQKRGPDET